MLQEVKFELFLSSSRPEPALSSKEVKKFRTCPAGPPHPGPPFPFVTAPRSEQAQRGRTQPEKDTVLSLHRESLTGSPNSR